MPPRMTLQTQLVLRALLRAPGRELYGLELLNETGLASGTARPILARLEKEGWVTSRQEDVDPHQAGRPSRRYYSLTPDGAAQATAALASAPRLTHTALADLAKEPTVTFTSRDLRDQVVIATDASDGAYDVDGIVDTIIVKHGAVPVDSLDHDEFWAIVAAHTQER